MEAGVVAGRRFATVVLDCDSTLSAVEGIDELGAAHREQISAMTDAAMRGEVPLEEVYGRRLALVQPSRDALDALGRTYIARLVPDAERVVRALHREGIDVHVVSGGLLHAVRAVAESVGIPAHKVHAVAVDFDEHGAYAGWDETSPLAYAGGKRKLLESMPGELKHPILVVGDGMTDLEARPAVDGFVAFAGVIAREAVVRQADWVVRSASLAPIFPVALGFMPPRDPGDRALYEAGLSLLNAASDSHPSTGSRA